MDVKDAQRFLNIPQTGIIDDLTRAALRNYQQKNNLVATGLFDIETETKMFPSVGGNLDTDLFNQPTIKQRLLPREEYLTTSEKRRYIFLHYTAGWENPYNVVSNWDADKRGPIATQFVIGGINPVTGDPKYDGEIVQCLPDIGYGWHLSIGNNAVHRQSIGIEVCNFGWVTKGGYVDLKTGKGVSKKPNSFYTYTGTEIKPEFVTDLGREFRGFRYFHTVTEKQIESLEYLIKILCSKHNIDPENGLKKRLLSNTDPFQAFEFSQNIVDGKEASTGIYCHTNVVKSGKWDLSPTKPVIDMILNLGGK